MDKKKHSQKVTEEEKGIFREAMKKMQPSKGYSAISDKTASNHKANQNNLTTFLSDQMTETEVTPDSELYFARSGIPPKQMKRLKHGQIPRTATLDLHGLDSESASKILIEFINQAYLKNKRCVKIIHGKGHTKIPILKNKINNWLRQFEVVLAFCTALQNDGGTGAIYVLIKLKSLS